MDDYDELIAVFAATNNKKEMNKLFEELFTQREKYDFALRWRLLKELHDGTTKGRLPANWGSASAKSPEDPESLRTASPR